MKLEMNRKSSSMTINPQEETTETLLKWLLEIPIVDLPKSKNYKDETPPEIKRNIRLQILNVLMTRVIHNTWDITN